MLIFLGTISKIPWYFVDSVTPDLQSSDLLPANKVTLLVHNYTYLLIVNHEIVGSAEL